jgi:hypothetical protein
MLFELKKLLVQVKSFSQPLFAFGNKLSLGMSQDFFEMLSHQSGRNSTADEPRFTQIEFPKTTIETSLALPLSNLRLSALTCG